MKRKSNENKDIKFVTAVCFSVFRIILSLYREKQDRRYSDPKARNGQKIIVRRGVFRIFILWVLSVNNMFI